jgi:hypothetical protein
VQDSFHGHVGMVMEDMSGLTKDNITSRGVL